MWLSLIAAVLDRVGKYGFLAFLQFPLLFSPNT